MYEMSCSEKGMRGFFTVPKNLMGTNVVQLLDGTECLFL